jgi:hypothetical protein
MRRVPRVELCPWMRVFVATEKLPDAFQVRTLEAG